MREQLIDFETAKLAKEKGFDWKTVYYYDFIGFLSSGNSAQHWNGSKESIYSTPTQSLLQKWLRERPTPIIVTPEYDFIAWVVWVDDPDKDRIFIDKVDGKWINKYEDSLEIGLYQALKLIK